MQTPLATQPAGTGIPMLGANVINVLCRRREESAEEEEGVAQRLMHAWLWLGNKGDAMKYINEGRQRPEPVDLVVRTLLVRFGRALPPPLPQSSPSKPHRAASSHQSPSAAGGDGEQASAAGALVAAMAGLQVLYAKRYRYVSGPHRAWAW